jgi:hypothetical protein
MYHPLFLLASIAYSSFHTRIIVQIRHRTWMAQQRLRVIEWKVIVVVDGKIHYSWHCRTWGDPWRVTGYWPWWYLRSFLASLVILNRKQKLEILFIRRRFSRRTQIYLFDFDCYWIWFVFSMNVFDIFVSHWWTNRKLN